jgi:biopolymer transport protein ExbD
MAAKLLFHSDELDAVVSTINTTPLVDVMLVLLIIFMITVPVVVHSVPVALPRETNQPARVKPDTIILAVDRAGAVYWNDAPLADDGALLARLKARAPETPQPEVHIRADTAVRYEFVGRIIADCQRAGIATVAFITQPDRGAGAAH